MSQEAPLLAGGAVGVSFSSSGDLIRDITGLGSMVTTAVVTSPASITFPSVPTVQYSKDEVHTLHLGCSFELPSEMALVPNRTNTQSINQRLGNMGTPGTHSAVARRTSPWTRGPSQAPSPLRNSATPFTSVAP